MAKASRVPPPAPASRGRWLAAAVGLLAVVVVVLMQARSRSDGPGPDPLPAAVPAAAAAVPVFGFRIVRVFPHDPEAFTQGLVYKDGYLFESTGLHGRSSLRRVKLETGEVVQKRVVEATYFAEGLALWRDTLLQLTWQSNVGLRYDATTFKPTGTFSYTGEGWGLTQDGTRLIMSDGTAALRFLDPETQRETGRLTVTDRGAPVHYLNELEWVKGEVFANVWQTDRIARIDPRSGNVTGWIDLAGILKREDLSSEVDVMNGIAYDAAGDRLFVTGKLWPKLFEIQLERRN